MGAGCGYTSRIDRDITFWVEIPSDDESEEGFSYEWDDLVEDLRALLESIGYSCLDKRGLRYANGLLDLRLESTYYGDGIVFDFDVREWLDASTEALARATYAKSWRKVARNLMKWGFKLRIPTSGWSARYMEQSDVA